MRVLELDEAYGVVLDKLEERKKKFCFIVFSSKERHIEVIIDWIEQVMRDVGHYDTRRLDESLKSGDSQYSELRDLLHECSFSVVILDGMRPNILFEYGILKGLGKPCIVLLEEHASVDVLNYYGEDESKRLEEAGIKNPHVDLDKHFSDVKDRYCVRYSQYGPKKTREKILKAFTDLTEQINDEFVRLVLPERELLKKQLRTPLSELSKIVGKEKISTVDSRELKKLTQLIDDILVQNSVKLVPKYYIEVAYALLRADKPQDALDLLDSAIENSFDYYHLIGLKSDILLSLNKINEAEESANEGLKLKPDESGFWRIMGQIHMQRQEYENAEESLRKSIKLDGEDSTPHYYLGRLYSKIGNHNAALAEYNEALRIEPEQPLYAYAKAKTLIEAEKREEAAKIAKQMISRDARSAEGYHILAVLAETLEDKLSYIEKIIEIDPTDLESICWKASTLIGMNRSVEALKLYERISRECPPEKRCPKMKLGMARCLSDAGRHEDAIKKLDEIIDMDTRDIPVLNQKAVILLKAGRDAEALKVLDNAIEIDSKYPTLYYNKACALAKMESVSESIAFLMKAISMDPKYRELMRTDSDFDGIRSHPDFKAAFG